MFCNLECLIIFFFFMRGKSFSLLNHHFTYVRVQRTIYCSVKCANTTPRPFTDMYLLREALTGELGWTGVCVYLAVHFCLYVWRWKDHTLHAGSDKSGRKMVWNHTESVHLLCPFGWVQREADWGIVSIVTPSWFPGGKETIWAKLLA